MILPIITEMTFSDDFQTATVQLEGGNTIIFPTKDFAPNGEVDENGDFTVYHHGGMYYLNGVWLEYPDKEITVGIEEHLDKLFTTDKGLQELIDYDCKKCILT